MGNTHCTICDDSLRTKRAKHLNCGHTFCRSCIRKQGKYKAGDLIQNFKHQCPECRDPIKLRRPGKSCFHDAIRNSCGYIDKKYLAEDTYYKFCISCNKVYKAGDRTCQADPEKLSDICDNCVEFNVKRTRKCPNCPCLIEWVNACARVRCTECNTAFCFVHYKTKDEILKMKSDIQKNPNSYYYGQTYLMKLKKSGLNNGVYGCPDCVINKTNGHSYPADMSIEEILEKYPLRVTKKIDKKQSFTISKTSV